jgi:hypothetical protein
MKRPESDPLISAGAEPSDPPQFWRVGFGMGSLPVGVAGVHSAACAPVSTSAHGLLLFACSAVLVADVVSVASNDPR